MIPDPDFYFTISKSSTAEFKDRGSRFIAYAYPITSVDEFKKILAALKKEHPKAVHHCFAYRIGPGGVNFRVSDDGEPSGSAGRPILGQIDSKQLTNVLVLVVRYFGGSLLGVPGLINAYKTATITALDLAGKIEKTVLINYDLQFDYTKMNEVMRIIKQLDLIVISQEIQLFCSMVVGIPAKKKEEALSRFKDLRGLTIEDKLV